MQRHSFIYTFWRLLFPMAVVLLLFGGCSTKKNKTMNVKYHNMTSKYNGWFNSKEIIRFDEKELEKEVEDDYDYMLPVFKASVEDNRDFMMGNMETVIEKCSRVIHLHSIDMRGKEHVDWIDDCYFLMGKANYYKGEFKEAKKFFEFVSKKFKETNSALPAMTWLARTHVELENYNEAERILRLLNAEKELDDDYRIMTQLITADLFIRQKNYPLALPELRDAINAMQESFWDRLTKKRRYSRLIFLMGQIYKEMDEYDNAGKEFEKVVDINLNYRQVFFARIERAMTHDGGVAGGDRVREELHEMLNDEKYEEFRDRIYYALAEMAYNEGDKEHCKELLKKSSAASMGDQKQKSKTFLRLADIYFDDLEYVPAQQYYDSAVGVLDPEHERYEDIVLLAENLNKLVTHINTIKLQDSLQNLARMSEAEREAVFDSVISAREKEERKKQAELEAEEFRMEMGLDDQGGMKIPGMGGGGKWYFYNQNTVSQGKSEFQRIWGKRNDEDDWRRSDKRQEMSVADEIGFEDDTAGFVVDDKGDTIEISNDWREYSFYLKDLPLNEDRMAISDSMIRNAYYQKGIVYREKLEDHKKAIETYEEYIQRYPENEHLAAVYYRLYRMHDELKNESQAEYYKNKVLNEFPETDYAKIIQDPKFLEREEELLKEAKEHYVKTYEYFEKEFYAACIEACREGMQKYTETKFEPKFALIYALSVGKEQGRETMVTELQTVKNRYDTISKEISDEAQAYLEAIKAVEKREEEADKEEEPEEMPYEYDADERHLFIVLLPADGSVNTRSLRVRISDFNRKNYRTKNLQISPIQLSSEVQMVSVKDFSNSDKAVNYYRAFTRNKDQLKDVNEAALEHFVVSYSNYATLYQEKNTDLYMKFFKQNYNKAL